MKVWCFTCLWICNYSLPSLTTIILRGHYWQVGRELPWRQFVNETLKMWISRKQTLKFRVGNCQVLFASIWVTNPEQIFFEFVMYVAQVIHI